jgi:hypothetical protein
MQLASPLIDCPQKKLTNRIRIAMITSDSESLKDRNTPEVVKAARSNHASVSSPHEARRLALRMRPKQAASSEAAMS